MAIAESSIASPAEHGHPRRRWRRERSLPTLPAWHIVMVQLVSMAGQDCPSPPFAFSKEWGTREDRGTRQPSRVQASCTPHAAGAPELQSGSRVSYPTLCWRKGWRTRAGAPAFIVSAGFREDGPPVLPVALEKTLLEEQWHTTTVSFADRGTRDPLHSPPFGGAEDGAATNRDRRVPRLAAARRATRRACKRVARPT
jgi:hypothetical protein